MALSLAQKLGAKRNLTAFSLCPGIVMTNLSSHLDLGVDFKGCREYYTAFQFGQGVS